MGMTPEQQTELDLLNQSCAERMARYQTKTLTKYVVVEYVFFPRNGGPPRAKIIDNTRVRYVYLDELQIF